jgi:hypothetical protein
MKELLNHGVNEKEIVADRSTELRQIACRSILNAFAIGRHLAALPDKPVRVPDLQYDIAAIF